MDTQDSIPIRRLTLYKHGVAFVERAGAVDGAEVRLTFRADEVNDALKSLLVVGRGGDGGAGGVLGLDYETPGDGDGRPEDNIFSLSDDQSLRDLLRGLRGWAVELITGDGPGDRLGGRVLGLDVAQPETMLSHTVVVLLDQSGAVVTVPLAVVRRVLLSDERAGSDLRVLLDRSRGEGTHRTVTVRLGAPAGRARDLAISYLVPCPTWRVSYRVVAEPTPNPAPISAPAEGPAEGDRRNGEVGADGVGGADAVGAAHGAGTVGAAADARAGARGGGDGDGDGGGGGTLLLQGWGLFDNRLEEDLDGVAVTLVAGQPVSFVYDLASSRIPERPVVEDAARVAAAPVEFDAPLMAAAPAPAPMAAMAAMAAVDMPAALASRTPRAARRAAATIEELSGQAVAATGGAAGELFQYEVTAPVTVRRGASALVPILGATLPYRRELLYNRAKLPGNPVAALRFANNTGLVLERGPAIVLEAGAYRGEAIVPFTKEEGEVYLPHAVELGIKVTVSSDTNTETAGLAIAGALLQLKSAVVTRTTYRLESSLGEGRRVTIEHPIAPGADLVAGETRAPDVRAGAHYRWDVPCAPRRATTFVVAERRYTWHSENLLDTSYARLREYLAKEWLDRATLDRLGALFEERAAVARNGEEIKGLWEERDALYKRQESLRASMAALGTVGEEGALRGQVVRDLAASEGRLRAIEARLDALKDENGRRQASIDAFLATLRVGDASPGQ